MARSGFKMKGNPMRRNFGIGGPMRKDETEAASVQEETVRDGVYYTDREGSTASPQMTRLMRAKPDVNSKEYDSWKKAYDRASAEYVASSKKEIEARKK